MCYFCSPTCEFCSHKLITCPECGWRNFLSYKKCVHCGLLFTDEMRAESERQWLENRKQRKINESKNNNNPD